MTTVHVPHDQAAPWVDGLTIGQVLRETAQRYPQYDAIVFCNPQARMTWSQFDAAVDRVGRGLLALGFAPGDHFGVWATNVPEWVLLQFATARVGVVLVNMNPAYRTGELEYALRQSDVRGLAIVDSYKSSNYFGMLNEACPELATAASGELQSETFPKLQWVVSLRGDRPPGALSWDELLTRADDMPHRRLDELAAGLSPYDAINIQYTSGTTGHPKGAMLSHRNILLNAFYAGEAQSLDQSDRVCLPVPLYHCFGCVLGTLCSRYAVRRWCFRPKVFSQERRSQPSSASTARPSTACQPCSSPSSSTKTIRSEICRHCARGLWRAAHVRSN